MWQIDIENNQICYMYTYEEDSIRIWDPQTNQAVEAYMTPWAKEKSKIVIWEFKMQEGNLYRDEKANVW